MALRGNYAKKHLGAIRPCRHWWRKDSGTFSNPRFPMNRRTFYFYPPGTAAGALVNVANREELYEVLDAGSNREKLYRM